MKGDEVRMAAYSRSIAAAARGKRVLDIGTGRDALLAIMAARAGAAKVVAVEVQESMAEAAREAVAREGLSDTIEVLSGYSTQLRLPRVDLVIHELVGNIATEEGLALVLADLQARPDVVDSSAAGWVLPARVLTWVAPVSLHVPVADEDEDGGEDGGDGSDGGEGGEGGACDGHGGGDDTLGAPGGRERESPREVRWPGVLPAAVLLGDRRVLEDVSSDSPVALEHARSFVWQVAAPGTLTGFACAPHLELDSVESIDAWKERTHWRNVIVLLPEAALVDPGDEIHLQVTLSVGRFPAEYRFSASLRPAAATPGAAPSQRQLGTSVISLDVPTGAGGSAEAGTKG